MRLGRFAVLFLMLNAIGFLVVALMALTARAESNAFGVIMSEVYKSLVGIAVAHAGIDAATAARTPIAKPIVFTPKPLCNPGLDPYLCGHPIPNPNKDYIITKDTGGVINFYLLRYGALKNTRIIVDGLCNSACTLVLRNDDVCVTDKAWFGFHTASTEAGTALLLSLYPQKVKDWIAAHGGLTTKTMFARGHELAPRCKL